MGWNISLSSIKRRTDKLVPRYQDADNSDIFQLTGVEDLVLQLRDDGMGGWQPDSCSTGQYLVRRYRPLVESAFTLIEQATSPTHGMYWKTTQKDNTVTFYGFCPEGRVADPADPSRIYEWLPDISYDDKGNCFQFFYVPEDLVNVPKLLHEGNRLNGNQGIANTYLKQVVYGNTTPYKSAALAVTNASYTRRAVEWQFQLTLANDELTQVNTQIQAAQNKIAIATQDEQNQQLLIQNAENISAFLTDKYTNEQLYTWMITQRGRLRTGQAPLPSPRVRSMTFR